MLTPNVTIAGLSAFSSAWLLTFISAQMDCIRCTTNLISLPTLSSLFAVSVA